MTNLAVIPTALITTRRRRERHGLASAASGHAVTATLIVRRRLSDAEHHDHVEATASRIHQSPRGRRVWRHHRRFNPHSPAPVHAG